MKGLIKKILREQKSEIFYLPGDNKWEYTLINNIWHTRGKGSEKKWISLGDDKWEKTTRKLDKAFNPEGKVKSKEETKHTQKVISLDYDSESAWKALRKQTEDRLKKSIEEYEWGMLMDVIDIPEEEFEEPQVIKDLNAMIEAIHAGKSDSYLMKMNKSVDSFKLDPDKIAFWRKQYNTPELKSVWVRGKDKINKWLKGIGKSEGDVASKEEIKEFDKHIKKTLREFKKDCPKGMYFCGTDKICKPESQKMGDINNTGDMELNEVGFTTDYAQEVLNDLDNFIEVVKGPISELRQQKSFPSEVNAHLVQRLYSLLSEGGELHTPTQELIDILSELDDKQQTPIGFRVGGNY